MVEALVFNFELQKQTCAVSNRQLELFVEAI